jgi:hypothetical protein
MSTQKTDSSPTIRSRLHNRRVALLSTFTALIFISELVQAQFLETLNLGFGVELSDVFGLIGLTFTGWYAAPFFAIAHAVANPGLAVQIIPRDFLSLAMAGLAIDRLKSQPWIRDQQWLMFFVPWAPTAATITAIILDRTTGPSLDSGLGFLQGLATSFPAAVIATFAYFAIHRKVSKFAGPQMEDAIKTIAPKNNPQPVQQ